MGKKLFVVSVIAIMQDKTIEEFEIKKEPKIVSRNKELKSSASYQENSVNYDTIRPGSQGKFVHN